MANSKNDGCECDAGYDKKKHVYKFISVYWLLVGEDEHTYIKCVDWCCDREGAGNN